MLLLIHLSIKFYTHHFFRKHLTLNILEQPSDNELVFELIGVDVSFANALRRIMIAEVPTVAIEHVYMWNNSSIVHDEVLSHRLGLVPINIDPRLFETFEENDEPTDRNTVVFRLEVKCGKSKSEDLKRDAARKMRENSEQEGDDSVLNQMELDTAAKESAELYQATHVNPQKIAEAIETPGRPYTRHVYSKDLEWVPQGDQADRFDTIRPVHEDILLAKLRPGQWIELEAHARKGVGKDHAKFSPVATAAYRLMPKIELVKPVYDELAEQLVNLYEPGVFRLEECTGEEASSHRVKAVVHNPYACTMSRNFMRDPVLKESVKITRVPNHFIFSVESVGMLQPGVIVAEALRVLQDKCRNLVRLVDESTDNNEGL